MLMIAGNSLIATCLQQVPAQPHELYTRMEQEQAKHGALDRGAAVFPRFLFLPRSLFLLLIMHSLRVSLFFPYNNT